MPEHQIHYVKGTGEYIGPELPELDDLEKGRESEYRSAKDWKRVASETNRRDRKAAEERANRHFARVQQIQRIIEAGDYLDHDLMNGLRHLHGAIARGDHERADYVRRQLADRGVLPVRED